MLGGLPSSLLARSNVFISDSIIYCYCSIVGAPSVCEGLMTLKVLLCICRFLYAFGGLLPFFHALIFSRVLRRVRLVFASILKLEPSPIPE